MKIIVHFCAFIQQQNYDTVQDFLLEKSICFEKRDYLDNRTIVSFDITEESNDYGCVYQFMLEFKPIITKYTCYSKEELDNSQWLSVLCYWGKIDLPTEYAYNQTFSNFCIECKTKEQIDLYRVKKAPKWKKRKNFCADSSGGWDKLFCSEYAKHIIEINGIKGIDFNPVLCHKTLEPIENLYQLEIKTIVEPFKVDFSPKPIKKVCDSCRKIKFINSDNISEMSFNQNYLTKDIDAFVIPIYTNGCKLIVISNKFYRILEYELQEETLDFKSLSISQSADGSLS